MGLMEKVNPMLQRCPCVTSPVDEKPKEKEKPKSNVDENGRIQWASPTEFLLTCIGYSVGLGNVWRFPYLCYKSGGGAFLIPYIIMMFLIGMPLLFMEYGFGQYFGVGSLSIFKKVCPMFQGIGIGYIILNGLVCVYYNVIIALSLYYLFASLTKNLPWGSCGHEWNTPYCGDPVPPALINGTVNSTLGNMTDFLGGNLTSEIQYGVLDSGNSTLNGTLNVTEHTRFSPSDEYFRHAVLAMTSEHSISNIGSIRWHLCLCLLLAWILVVIFVSRGIQSTGKVAYFTATFPYVMLTVLVVRGVTLPGAATGILYFVTPDWEKLKDPDVWFGAATQLFYSTNLAWGGMITMASYNSFSHNCYRDAIMINIVSFFTSIYAGFAVFSIIGYMANEYGLEVSQVIDSGPGLAFIVYPRALSLMPLAPMWSALFFFMLFLLGVGSQMVLIETVVTGFVDEFPFLGRNACKRLSTTIFISCVLLGLGIACTAQMVDVETVMSGIMDEFPKLRNHRLPVLFCVAAVFFFLGLAQTAQMVGVETVMSGLLDEFQALRNLRMPVLIGVAILSFGIGLAQVTQGGMYVLQLMDWYSAGFCVLVIAVCECMVINWIYGNDKFAANIKEMLGTLPPRWWRICWKFISPLLISAILIFSFIKYEPAKYGSYVYPAWADGIGWCLALASITPIAVVAIYKLVTAEGNTFREKLKEVTTPKVVIEKKLSPIEVDVEASEKAGDDNLDESLEQRHTLLEKNGQDITKV